MALSRRKRPQMTAGEGILVRGPLEDRLFVSICRYNLYIIHTHYDTNTRVPASYTCIRYRISMHPKFSEW